MAIQYRDLRYLRLPVDDLGAAAAFASDVIGLQPADIDSENARFRSDARNYSLCYSRDRGPAAVALTVPRSEDIDAQLELLKGHGARMLDADACKSRQIKRGLTVMAPNGVAVELVWRPMTSGWRYHGPRDAGITEFGTVQLACRDIAANEEFWIKAIGASVSDWIGDAVFLRIDDAHHRVALYPSSRDGVLGVSWEVENINNVMQDWYYLQSRQVPIVQGPGRHPASGAVFVTARGPGDIYYSYMAELERGPQIVARGPRQFNNVAASHCAWGSVTSAPEFMGGEAQ